MEYTTASRAISQYLENRDILHLSMTCKAIHDLFHIYIDPGRNDNGALCTACWSGHGKLVKQLLKRSITDRRIDPGVGHNFPIRYASKCGHYTVVKLLLDHSLSDARINPGDDDNFALLMAKQNKYFKIVELLLEHSLFDSRINPHILNIGEMWYLSSLINPALMKKIYVPGWVCSCSTSHNFITPERNRFIYS